MGHSLSLEPFISQDKLELAKAMVVWEAPFRCEPEEVLRALSIVRYYRTEAKAGLRGLSRTSDEYRDLKRKEELLEGVALDLHDAWMTQLSARKHGG